MFGALGEVHVGYVTCVPVDVSELAEGVQAETRELELLLTHADWSRPTPAIGWTIHDQVTHVAFFDDAAVRAATDPDAFRADLDALVARGGDPTGEVVERYRAMDAAEAHAWFQRARASLVATLTALDPAMRVPWYGPDMSVASSLTARIMETWAHGQDVADALGAPRTPTHALRHVAHIGVRTFANSFVTHGLEVPDTPVVVVLRAPDGEQWSWGDPAATDRVEGDAIDFCLVVTQRRHPDDTDLTISGEVAARWMAVAQAFAGPPGPGRRPGQFA